MSPGLNNTSPCRPIERRDEWSAGGVIYRYDASAIRVLLCLQRKLSGRRSYCLPKGHLEPGETPEQAAVREVREETGLRVSIQCPLGSYEYVFSSDGRRICKRVDMFLMRFESHESRHTDETEGMIWCDRDQALGLNPYEGERAAIERAYEIIERGTPPGR